MALALDLINGYAGMYVVQCLAHSIIAAIVADSSLVAWDVRNPMRRQLVRMNTLVLPLLMYPLFQLINPERGTIFTRTAALLDSNRWIQLDLWDRLPVLIPVAAVLGVTSVVFLFQELLPVLRHTVENLSSGRQDEAAEREGSDGADPDGEPDKYDHAVESALDGISGPRPESYIIEDEDLVIFSSTGRKPAIYVSTGFIDAFAPQELRAALAHEAAHIRRSRHPVLIALFVLRVIMFFNPVAMLEFRKIVQEEERICDEMAVRLTDGDPRPLSSALARLVVHQAEDLEPDEHAGIGSALESIENYSHDMQMRSRIKQLMEERGEADAAEWLHYAASTVATVAICYFVV